MNTPPSNSHNTVIKIQRHLSERECDYILKSYSQQESVIHLKPGIAIPKSLSHFQFESIDLEDEIKKKINYSCLQEILAFGDQKLGGIQMSTHLQYETLNLWYYNKFRIYFEYRNNSYLKEEIKIAFKQFENVALFSEPNELITENAKLNWLKSNPHKRPPKFKKVILYSWSVVVRILKSCLKEFPTSKSHLILSGPNRQQPYLSLDTLRPHPDDQVLGYLMEQYPSRFVVIDEYQVPDFDDNKLLPKNTKHKGRKTVFGEYIMFLGLLSTKIRKQASIVLTEKMKFLEQSKDAISNPDHLFILAKLLSLKNSHWYFILRYESYKRFFEKYRQFKTLTTIDENAQFYKSIVDAAKFNSLKTIAVQHGNIYDLHLSYMFSNDDNVNQPFAETTVTWGKYWNDLLILKGHYPSDRLVICGQPRTDIISRLTSKKTSKGTFKILFASQPQRDLNLRLRATTDILKAASQIDDAELIIKLHPREADHKYFHNLAKKQSTTNYSLSYKDDLYGLINDCDALITCFSTVAGEAVYFNKPVITFDPLKQDLMKYHEIGVAFQATGADDLLQILKDIKANKLEIDESAYSDFIEKYAYRIDGKVCERIMDVIESNQ